jgi:hypothetical protein
MKRVFRLLRAAARRRGLACDRRGSAAVEFAFAAMPLFLFLFTIFNAGYALWLQNALDISVADAARCAAVNASQCGTASQVASYAAGRSGAGFDSSVFSFSQASCGKQVSASYPLSLPLVSHSLTLSAQACYPS